MVGNIRRPLTSIPLDAQILIDGDSGEVIVNPSDETRARYQARRACRGQGLQLSRPVPGLKVMANIGQSADIDSALAAGAEGVGL